MLRLTTDNLLLVSCDKVGYIECNIAYWLLACIPIMLTTLCVVGNTLNITVLLRKHFRKKSTCIFLLVLAFSDSICLCSGALLQTARVLQGCSIYIKYPSLCNIPRWLAYSSGFVSCWLIVFVTIERSLLTLSPITVKPKLTPRNALFTSLALIMISISYNGHLLYGFTITRSDDSPTLNNTGILCSVSCSVRQGDYAVFYDNAWNILITLSNSIVPIFLVVTGNAIVGISLIKRQRALRRVRHQEEINEISEGANTRSTKHGINTKIFFILSGVYVFTTVPYGVFIINMKQSHLVDEHTFSKYQLLNGIVRCILFSNFSFNFLLYFMTGSLFKKEFRKIIIDIFNFFRTLTRPPVTQNR